MLILPASVYVFLNLAVIGIKKIDKTLRLLAVNLPNLGSFINMFDFSVNQNMLNQAFSEINSYLQFVDLSPDPYLSRPCPSDQHAPGHLRPTETARHHPLPSGCKPTCDISEVGERWIPTPSGEGESDLLFCRDSWQNKS